MTRPIAVYISGHGYGHLARVAPVLNRLSGMIPDIHLILCTALPVDFLSRLIRVPFTLHTGAVDIGVVQKNAISEDIPATMLAARDFYEGFVKRIGQEVERLKSYQPVAVLSDISPLAFPVAKRLGIPCFGIANLDWHDIYRDFLPADDPLLSLLAQAHSDCDLLIQPSLCMPMTSFPRRKQVEIIVDDEWTDVAKQNEVQKTALIMFGGAGDPPFDIHSLGSMSDWQFLTLNPIPTNAPANVRQGSLKRGSAALMQKCDVVVTKPGYGTLAECWQTKTPLVYLPRDLFPEYPYLDTWLQKSAPSARLSIEAFVSGNWEAAMKQAIDCRRTYPNIPCSGALQAAELIAQAL